MKTSINVSAGQIVALRYFAARSDIRHYLNGMLLESSRRGVFLVATNGHMLGAFRADQTPREPFSVIIPNNMLAHVRNKGRATLTVEREESGGKPAAPATVSVSYNGLTTVGQEIEGTFPNWRKVVPAKVSGEAQQFNSSYLVAINKAARAVCPHRLAGGAVSIAHNGPLGGAVVSIGAEDFCGVIMPVATYGECPRQSPEWARA